MTSIDPIRNGASVTVASSVSIGVSLEVPSPALPLPIAIPTALSTLDALTRPVINDVRGAARSAGSALGTVTMGTANVVSDVAGGVASTIKTGIQKEGDVVKSTMIQAAQSVGHLVDGVVDAAKGAGRLVTTSTSYAWGVLCAVSSDVTRIAGNIASTVTGR